MSSPFNLALSVNKPTVYIGGEIAKPLVKFILYFENFVQSSGENQ